MLLFKQNIAFFNLTKFIYYFIKNKLMIINLSVSLKQFQVNNLKLNQDYKLKLITMSLKDLDTFLLLLLEKLGILGIKLKLSYLPNKWNITTVLRSPFIYKKTQDQLLLIKYKAILYLKCNKYNFFYQYYLEFLITTKSSFLSKVQYNEIFSWNIKD